MLIDNVDQIAKTAGVLVGMVTAAAGAVVAVRKAFPTNSRQTARDMMADNRKYQDYAHELRRVCAEHGITPPDWPEGLKQ